MKICLLYYELYKTTNQLNSPLPFLLPTLAPNQKRSIYTHTETHTRAYKSDKNHPPTHRHLHTQRPPTQYTLLILKPRARRNVQKKNAAPNSLNASESPSPSPSWRRRRRSRCRSQRQRQRCALPIEPPADNTVHSHMHMLSRKLSHSHTCVQLLRCPQHLPLFVCVRFFLRALDISTSTLLFLRWFFFLTVFFCSYLVAFF